MACKNCAAMNPRRLHLPLLVATLLGVAVPVQANKADRSQALVYTCDQPAKGDFSTGQVVLRGNVVITQGTMRLLAEVVRLSQTPEGFYQAFADGTTEHQVNYHEARDEPGEAIEGRADRIEYDTRADTVRLIGSATLRQMHGSAAGDEVNGELIVYDNRTQQVTVDGNPAGKTAGGRVRGVLMPRAASAPAPSSAASGVALQPSTTLRSGKGS